MTDPSDSPKPPAPSRDTNSFPRDLLGLFDRFVHGDIDRRAFLAGASTHSAALGLSATGILAALSPDFAAAQTILPDDKRIVASRKQIASPKGSGFIRAYVVRPAKVSRGSKLPVILVAHENRGLNPHIEDIARRIALEGYIAIAPDALTAIGGYPGDEDKARAAFSTLNQPKIKTDFLAAAEVAIRWPSGNGKLGAVGFCWGGGMANYLAANVPELSASVPFYGPPPPLDQVPNIKARLLLHFAGNDARINAMWPDYEKALKAAHIPYEAFIYSGVEHGFNNNTTPRFNAEAAALAWDRTLKLFAATLKG